MRLLFSDVLVTDENHENHAKHVNIAVIGNRGVIHAVKGKFFLKIPAVDFVGIKAVVNGRTADNRAAVIRNPHNGHRTVKHNFTVARKVVAHKF